MTEHRRGQIRLFCFPHAGGGTAGFRGWARLLPATIECHPVCLPGRERRIAEAPFQRLAPLVDSLVHSLLPRLDKPFALFGHSFGALIAFEVARTLRQMGLPAPLHFFASGRHAPQVPPSQPPIHELPDEQLWAELRRLNGTSEAVLGKKELMELLLPALRADCAVEESYIYAPGEPLRCGLSALGGLQDPDVSSDALAAWREQTLGPFIQRMLPGDHFFLDTAREEVLRTISEDLLIALRS